MLKHSARLGWKKTRGSRSGRWNAFRRDTFAPRGSRDQLHWRFLDLEVLDLKSNA
jgi:hypothetical protein